MYEQLARKKTGIFLVHALNFILLQLNVGKIVCIELETKKVKDVIIQQRMKVLNVVSFVYSF